MNNINPYFTITISKIKNNKINCHIFFHNEDDEYTITLNQNNKINIKKIHIDFGCDIVEEVCDENDIQRLKEHLKIKYIKYCDEINEYKEEMVDQPFKYQNNFLTSISDLEFCKKVIYIIITNKEYSFLNKSINLNDNEYYENWCGIMDVISV